jgi:hypothetical protein
MKLLHTRLPLSSWLLVALLPALGALALGCAFHTYRGLQNIILEGFDRKLIAVSTITAAFTDPEELLTLTGPLPVGGGGIDSVDGGLRVVNRLTGEFLRIDTNSGQAEPTGVRSAQFVSKAASGDQPGTLFVAASETGVIQRVSTDTGEATPAFELGSPIYALATDVSGGRLYVAGREFTRVDLRTQERTTLAPLPLQPTGMTFDPTRQALWVLNPEGDALLEVDAADGRVRRELALRYDPAKPDHTEGSAAFSHPDVPVALQAVVFDPVSRRLFGLGTALVVINPETGFQSGGGFVHAFGRERSTLYLQYARMFRSLHNRIGTTFLYTQQIHGQGTITYGIDATIGENHSPLLSIDELPAADIEGVQAAIANGTVYAGGVQRWDQWGLMKSVVAPIFDPATGQVAALVGADVDIGTIQFDTHQALVITVSAGLAMMLAAGLLAVVIARKINAPLGLIRAGALRAAAGDYSQRVEVSRPLDLRDLAQQFSRTTATLQDLVLSLQIAVARRQAGRDAAALEQRLRALAAEASPDARWAFVEPGDHPLTASGVVQGDSCALVWLAPATTDSAGSALQAATLATLARALLRRYGPDRAALTASLTHLPANSVAWLLLEGHDLTVLVSTEEARAAVHLLNSGTTVVALPPVPAKALRSVDGQPPGPALASLRAVAPAGTFLLVALRS